MNDTKYIATAELDRDILKSAKRQLKEHLAAIDGGVKQGIDVVVHAMEVAETRTDVLKGTEKAALVKQLVQDAEIKSLLPSSVVEELNVLKDSGMLDPLMQIVCQAAKNAFDINSARDAADRVAKAFKKLCPCCFK